MKDHRLLYLDLQPAPVTDLHKVGPRLGRCMPDWVLVAFALALLAVELFRPALPPGTPAASTAPAFETRTHAIEEARIEGFRAGINAAGEAGCTATPALSQPITAR
jgi:hypothetical protein